MPICRGRDRRVLLVDSGGGCAGDDLAEPFVVGVVVAPDDVPADHPALFLVPSSAKYRSAVNWGSMRFNQDELVCVQAISTLFAVSQVPARRSLGVLRYGLKLSQMIAIRTDDGRPNRLAQRV